MNRALFASLAALMSAGTLTAEIVPHRWVYVQMNLQVAENVPVIEGVLERAAAVGYNGMVLADYKLNILGKVPNHYFKHAERIKRKADGLGVEIIPCVAPFGYSDGLLAHDPSLAEGPPVRGARFRVVNGAAELVSNVAPLENGDFSTHRRQRFTRFDMQDEPGVASFADESEFHSAPASLRFDDLGTTNPSSGNGRVMRRVAVRPWSELHASVWIKTKSFTPANDLRMFAMAPSGKVLSYSYLGAAETQDWRQHHVMFNSLENEEIRLYVGSWGGQKGSVWFDDLKLEETAFVNLIRRPGAPLKITTTAGVELTEGKDFAPLVDEKMGNQPYAGSFDVYHQPPTLRMLPSGRAKDGDSLIVSYYHALTVHENQICSSLAEPKVFELLRDQVERVERLFQPKRYFFSHDEIRVANWTPSDLRPGRSAGRLLAENVRRCVEVARAVNPKAELCIWSDMFDPHHNAVKNFYLVNGDLSGSWEGLPNDMTIINWNSGKGGQSLKFFADRGHRQILAGYYDGAPSAIVPWMEQGRGVGRLAGAMYTTWRQDYGNLEAFAKHAWGGSAASDR